MLVHINVCMLVSMNLPPDVMTFLFSDILLNLHLLTLILLIFWFL